MLAKPEPGDASLQVKLTVGAPVAALYQVVAAGLAGDSEATIVGLVASRLIETDTDFVPPALMA